MAVHGLSQSRPQCLPKGKAHDVSRGRDFGSKTRRRAVAIGTNRTNGGTRFSGANSGQPAGAAAGSVAIEISKRSQLRGDRRDHENIHEQRGRVDSHRAQDIAAAIRHRVARFHSIYTPNHYMKMNIDNPKLTAFALDELDEPERSTIARAVAQSPEAQRFVVETQELAQMLKQEYASELGEEAARPANLIDIRDDPWFWKIARPLSIAAASAIFAVIGALALGTYQFGGNFGEMRRWAWGDNTAGTSGEPTTGPANSPFAEVQVEEPAPIIAQATPLSSLSQIPMESILKEESKRDALRSNPAGTAVRNKRAEFSGKIAAMPNAVPPAPAEFERRDTYAGIRAPSGEFNTATYDHVVENPFLDAKENPLSTFSIDVDTASYSNIRRFINNGSLPPKDAVRVEEMINYFTYDYPQPTDDKPFWINLDATGCPWEPSHRLVRIGLKGREIAQDKRGASNLVFLLDVSGSMEPAERLPLIKQSMRLLVEKL